MIQFFVGVVVGIFIATVGVSGLTKIADHGVEAVKQQSRELAK